MIIDYCSHPGSSSFVAQVLFLTIAVIPCAQTIFRSDAMKLSLTGKKSLDATVLLVTLMFHGTSRNSECRAEQPGEDMQKKIPTVAELNKLPRDGGPEFNRLVFEKSPYLLQHACNPVNWYPWGPEAFAAARAQDKPIFLSIGYSTCHWCHVMQRESFENSEVAKLMNETFINIKVDREERPDIDNIYMSVCQALTCSGGWPLTVIMTPDKMPFFAGTYFPKEERFGRPGMLQLVPRMSRAWQTQRDKILTSAAGIIKHVRAAEQDLSGDELGPQTLERGFKQLSVSFDERLGGFGEAPKFPTPHNLSFLLRYWKRSGDPHALEMAERTLQAMRAGGMYDQIGFGFHRYATDANWLVPHFEKMLYDQALLTIAYVEAYQATGKKEYAHTAREILTYVLRDMTSPEGGFYSAEDADSEGVEGKFYLWTYAEVSAALPTTEVEFFTGVFDIKPDGNFSSQHSPAGTNIPHLTRDFSDLTRQTKMAPNELRQRIEQDRKQLFKVRAGRVHPYRDNKILTDWNGLMIAALATAARGLNEPEYAAAAQRAADFILKNMRDQRGRLLKRYRQGAAGLPAHVEDYAFLIRGLLDLYEANFKVRNLEAALELNHDLLEHFWDDSASGFFFTADDGEDLPLRSKEIYDGAIPSGNSVAMQNLLRLGRITGDTGLEEKAAALARAFSARVGQAPSAHTQLLCGLDFGVGPTREVVIVGDPAATDTQKMLQTLGAQFLPNTVVLLRPTDAPDSRIGKLASYLMPMTSLDQRATAYICRNYACSAPTTDYLEMLSILKEPAIAD